MDQPQTLNPKHERRESYFHWLLTFQVRLLHVDCRHLQGVVLCRIIITHASLMCVLVLIKPMHLRASEYGVDLVDTRKTVLLIKSHNYLTKTSRHDIDEVESGALVCDGELPPLILFE